MSDTAKQNIFNAEVQSFIFNKLGSKYQDQLIALVESLSMEQTELDDLSDNYPTAHEALHKRGELALKSIDQLLISLCTTLNQYRNELKETSEALSLAAASQVVEHDQSPIQ